MEGALMLGDEEMQWIMGRRISTGNILRSSS